MTHELSLFTAFILGLLGSGHCMGMCGGLMSALSIGSVGNTINKTQHLLILVGYNIGRLISYTIMGLLMGALGWFLAGFSRDISIALRIFAGLMLIMMGFYLAGWWLGLTILERGVHKIWRHIQPIASSLLPVTSPLKASIVGLCWGWLPCGLVYSTLVWAAASHSIIDSALLMFCFGLGTLPALLLTGIMAKQIQWFLQKKLVRTTVGILVIIFGLWTIPGPHQMWLMSLATH